MLKCLNVKIKNGFTLTELLVTTIIFVIVVGAIYSTQLLSQKAYQQGETTTELTQNGRVILERIVREIRQANEMVTPLPQVPDNPDNPPPSEIEFEDGHTPSPCQQLGSDHYYIRYYIYTPANPQDPKELRRQYRVYCFDDCGVCNTFFRWNDTRIVDSIEEKTHPCNLKKDCTLGEEENIVGEYLTDLKFWGSGLINISLTLTKDNKKINLSTQVFGRNL